MSRFGGRLVVGGLLLSFFGLSLWSFLGMLVGLGFLRVWLILGIWRMTFWGKSRRLFYGGGLFVIA